MKIKSLIIVIILLNQALIGVSQNSIDILNLSARYGFPSSYKDTYSGTATEFGTFLNLTVPITISKNTIWYNSLNHFYFNVKGDPVIPETEANPIILNGFTPNRTLSEI